MSLQEKLTTALNNDLLRKNFYNHYEIESIYDQIKNELEQIDFEEIDLQETINHSIKYSVDNNFDQPNKVIIGLFISAGINTLFKKQDLITITLQPAHYELDLITYKITLHKKLVINEY